VAAGARVVNQSLDENGLKASPLTCDAVMEFRRSRSCTYTKGRAKRVESQIFESDRGPAVERPPRPKAVAHFTPAERAAQGKAARAELPRSAHAGWEAAPRRRDPIDLLEEQAQTCLRELGPIRYGRMLVFPFAFFRGDAHLMAADLADGPRTGLQALRPGGGCGQWLSRRAAGQTRSLWPLVDRHAGDVVNT
jgi:Uncharacterized protein conserved in bacteria (DUF2252)